MDTYTSGNEKFKHKKDKTVHQNTIPHHSSRPHEHEIVKTTKEWRTPLGMKCKMKSFQKCHNAGLNLMKELVNHYADKGVIDDSLYVSMKDAIIHSLNDIELNLRCCSIQDNTKDKGIEEELMECIIDQKRGYNELSGKAIKMLNDLRLVLVDIQLHLSKINKEGEDVIKLMNHNIDNRIRGDFNAYTTPTCKHCNLTCFLIEDTLLDSKSFCDTNCQSMYYTTTFLMLKK